MVTARFDRALLDLASSEFVDGYEQRGGWRWFVPGYWQDRQRIRRLQTVPGKLAFADEVEALRRAQRVAASLAWFDQNDATLGVAFGTHYIGPETDWQAVSDALGTVREVVELKRDDVSEPLWRSLSAPGAKATAVAAVAKRLDAAVQRADAAIGELVVAAPVAPIARQPGGLEGAELAGLREWIRDQLERLRRIWQAADEATCFRCEPLPTTASLLVADLHEIGSLQSLERETAANRARLREEFGGLVAGLDTPWALVLSALDWTGKVLDQFAPAGPPKAFVDRVIAPGGTATFAGLIDRSVGVGQILNEEIAYLATLFAPETLRFDGVPLEEAPFEATGSWTAKHLDRLEELDDWIALKRVERELAPAGLAAYTDEIRRQGIAPELWEAALLKRCYTIWLDRVHREDPALREFRGTTQDDVVRRFRQLDRQQLDIASRRIRESLLSRRPGLESAASIAGSEPAVLRAELLKKRRHKPLRRLFREIPNLVTALKPCLLMSPLSVSYFLPADVYEFDVVVFDEASQIRPQDAVGAIMRGKQIIVVGDRKQLPPTQFFETSADDIADDEETDAGVFESILDECDARGMRSRVLHWHYRSRHENLIAFSNRHFYDGTLITFPSADPYAVDMGVRLRHVPDGVYDRGQTRVNRVEARRTAALVVDQLRRRPDRSLGVVTLSEPQMLAVLQELEAIRRRHPDLEPLFDEERPESFFVKNLEQVQGDERDVIILSVGYGKDAKGTMSMVFGPINRAGGERRLNVAITRAKDQVIVVSSIRAADIDLARIQSRGARLLKAYLDFAERGPIALEAETAQGLGEYESPFEEAVGSAVEEQGFTVQRQVGCSGYRIDLAVVDPERPGRYVLGVECDGATYHSSKTARERDRLRQEVLEQLGWRIHRVWSTDWVRDPRRELRRIVEAIARATELPPTGPDEAATDLGTGTDPGRFAPFDDGPPVEDQGLTVASELRRSAMPYRLAELGDNARHWGPLHAAPFHAVVAAVKSCIEQEGPISRDLLATRVANSWGIRRVGHKVESRINAALSNLERSGAIEARGDFAWPPGLDAVQARGPSFDGEVRQIQDVPLEEIAEAARLCAGEAFALPGEELVVATARMLGYERTGIHVFERINRGIELAIDRGSLTSRGGRITLTQM